MTSCEVSDPLAPVVMQLLLLARAESLRMEKKALPSMWASVPSMSKTSSTPLRKTLSMKRTMGPGRLPPVKSMMSL